MIRTSILSATTLFVSIGVTSHIQATELELVGLEADLLTNVNAHLTSIAKDDYSTSLRFQARLESHIQQALNALGYYHADVDFVVDKEQDKLVGEISPGPATVLSEVDIRLIGEAEQDPDFQNLVANSGLQAGFTLNHSTYENLKSAISSLALKKGYFSGRFTLSRLEVIPALKQANIKLHFESGIRHQFGELKIENSQIDHDKIYSLAPFSEGDDYQVAKIAEFNQNLSQTGWFSSVLVEPDLSLTATQRALPINVSLAPQARNQFETGIGFSTDVGPRGTLAWKKPWYNSRGHSIESRFEISKPEQVISASYKIPLEDVLREFYQVQYGMKKVDNRDTESLESNLSVERHWLAETGWQRTLYTRYLIENYEQGIQEDSAQFLLPGATVSRTRTRGGAMPNWGDKLSLTMEYGNESVVSETDVLRVIGGASWIRSLNSNHRGLVRLDGAANVTDEFSKLSPSLRFFAGGDNTIRGYNYESIAPTDSSGALTGGKYLATASAEYQYRVTGNWWLATFYDYGDAFNRDPEFKRGTGVGVRWQSPVGPIRLDFAWGLDATKGNEFQIHFTLGPEL